MERKTKQKGEPKENKMKMIWVLRNKYIQCTTANSDKQQPVFMLQAHLYSLNVECQITEVYI